MLLVELRGDRNLGQPVRPVNPENVGGNPVGRLNGQILPLGRYAPTP